MPSKHYATAYAVLFALVLLPAIFALLFLGRQTHDVTFLVLLAVAAVFPVIAIWLVRRMGFPLGLPIHCARCGTEQPMVRKPASRQQALWGGYTCAKCGAELDARGRERSPAK